MERRPDLDDLEAFVRVVEAGGLSRAAERLGVSKSIVSRRIARLEASLGARLLTRGGRGARPTEVGTAYGVRAARILTEIDAAHELVSDAVSEIAGSLRLTAPVSFGTGHLAPALTDFAARHPRVELDLALDDRVVDLVGGGYDLAVRIGDLSNSRLVARRLAPVRSALLASPDYLARRGRPRAARDFADHDGLMYANAGAEQWRFRSPRGWETGRPRARLRADNGEMLLAAAVAGLGLVVLPTFIASPAIERGDLEILLGDRPLAETGLYAVTPPGRVGTARVRALVDFLARTFGPEPRWDPCWRAQVDVSPQGEDRAEQAAFPAAA